MHPSSSTINGSLIERFNRTTKTVYCIPYRIKYTVHSKIPFWRLYWWISKTILLDIEHVFWEWRLLTALDFDLFDSWEMFWTLTVKAFRDYPKNETDEAFDMDSAEPAVKLVDVELK